MAQRKKIVAVLYEGGQVAKESPGLMTAKENALGLRELSLLKDHELIVTSDKDGPNCELEKHIPDMDILITIPFHPAYMTKDRLDRAKKLKLCITAGVGSDHIDLDEAAKKGIEVTEITGCNVVSVAEDEVMRVLLLMRNFVPAYKQIINGEWNVAPLAARAHDVEGKMVGTFGAGRIGTNFAKRMKNFDVHLCYYARSEKESMKQLGGVEYIKDMSDFLGKCDVISINVPLSQKTKGLFNDQVLSKMKRGAYLVNNARAAICDRMAVVRALESGHLAGYSGDVWDQQPAPKDHPWRYMPNHAMTPHTSGETLDAQRRIAEGVKEILTCWFSGKPIPDVYYIVHNGQVAKQYT